MRWASFAIAVALLGGCVGAGAPSAGPPSSEELLEANEGLIRGRVLDEELRGLSNATVAVASVSLIATTGDDGAFSLPPLPAGTYDVSAYALGYEAQARRIQLEAGRTVDALFTLRQLASAEAYFELFPYVGFESCQWYFEGAIAHCSLPYTQAHGTLRENGVNLSQYGLPPDIMDNRDRYNFTVGPNHTGIVSELVWQAASAAATWQALVLACGWYDPLWDECVPPGETHTGLRYHFVVGRSPIQLVWKMNQEELDYLKRSPWVFSRANVYGSDAVAAGFALDQRIEMFNTVFYGADPPEGYTAGPPDA